MLTLCSNLSLNGRELKSSSASAMLGIGFSEAGSALFMDLNTAHVSWLMGRGDSTMIRCPRASHDREKFKNHPLRRTIRQKGGSLTCCLRRKTLVGDGSWRFEV